MYHNSEISKAVLLIIAGSVLLQSFTEGRPTVEDGTAASPAVAPVGPNGQNCLNTPAVRNMCQMCAKVTKSRVAYPMCCSPEDSAGTRSWCLKFLNFGLTHHVWSFS